MKKVLVVLGPTATGKTDLALKLAKKFNGELVSCDSRQVYKGLDIGTGKLSGEEVSVKKHDGFWILDGIPVYLYDIANPNSSYNVYQYIADAKKTLDGILSQDKLPIIVGGTGLYLKGFLEGLSELSIPVDEKLRADLEKLDLSLLQEKLKSLSSGTYQNLSESDKKNQRRLIRALEKILLQDQKDVSKLVTGVMHNYQVLKIGLTAPRQILYERIDKRVVSRIDQGMIEEAQVLFRNGLSLKRMRELGLEYKYLTYLLEQKLTKEDFVKILQFKIHQYAKRQLTWFKNEREVCWFDITEANLKARVEKIVSDWYNTDND